MEEVIAGGCFEAHEFPEVPEPMRKHPKTGAQNGLFDWYDGGKQST